MILQYADIESASFRSLIELVQRNGGITITATEPAWSTGYVVGGAHDGEYVSTGFYHKLAAIGEARRRLQLGQNVGIWVEDAGKWVVDSVDRCPSKGAAILLAASRGERAYYDIGNNQVLDTYTATC